MGGEKLNQLRRGIVLEWVLVGSIRFDWVSPISASGDSELAVGMAKGR